MSRYYVESPLRDAVAEDYNIPRNILDRVMYDVYSIMHSTFRSHHRVIADVAEEWNVPTRAIYEVYNPEVTEMMDGD